MPGGAAISEDEGDERYVRKEDDQQQVITGPLKTDSMLTAQGGITGDLTGNADTATTATTADSTDQINRKGTTTGTNSGYQYCLVH